MPGSPSGSPFHNPPDDPFGGRTGRGSGSPFGRHALQGAIAVFGLVPVSAGLSGVLLGPGMAGLAHAASNPSLDSHMRYLSGLLLGIGLAFWGTIPRIERQGAAVRLLTALVFAGGLARLWGVATTGVPPPPMLFGLLMELVVTPSLCFWQARVARASGALPGSAPRA